MSIFSAIASKLGFGIAGMMKGSDEPAQTESETPVAETVAEAVTETSVPSQQSASIAVVDVVKHLEDLAAANPQKLNWKTSIVDLLKLLDIDSSLNARKELATELACPTEKMSDSAQMNMWLHKTVLQKIAQNGGNIPKELLD